MFWKMFKWILYGMACGFVMIMLLIFLMSRYA
jgi:tetrahydromethanopterin S-methyltransferase subunit G